MKPPQLLFSACTGEALIAWLATRFVSAILILQHTHFLMIKELLSQNVSEAYVYYIRGTFITSFAIISKNTTIFVWALLAGSVSITGC